MMSARGSRPKISSDRLTEPASLPSKVVIFISMLCALLIGGGFGSRRLGAVGRTELARLGRILVQRLLDRIANGNPAALGARNRAVNHDQATLDVDLGHLQIQGGVAIDAHVARHLLVLEGLARILTAAGRTDRTVRDRHTVRGAQTAEVPALHAAGETLADRDAADVDELAFDEVIGGDFRADRDQRIVADAEFRELALRLDLRLGEVAAIGLAHVAGATRARTELQRDVTVVVLGAMSHDLALRQAQHRHRNMFTTVGVQPGHSHLLCDDTRAHLVYLTRP